MIADFRKRVATDNIVILCMDTSCNTYEQFYKQCRRRGELDIGVHFFLDTFGNLSVGRAVACIADCTYIDNEVSVYIIAQSNTGALNSCQKTALQSLLVDLKLKYKNAKIIERTE